MNETSTQGICSKTDLTPFALSTLVVQPYTVVVFRLSFGYAFKSEMLYVYGGL